MARAIEFLAAARLDFDESFNWYHKRSVGAAIGFASAVDEAIGMIIGDPTDFHLRMADVTTAL